MIALATAMGIGRFAFTPVMPMMLHDGVINLLGASWLATANYIGYLFGALICTFQPLIWRRFPSLPQVGASSWVRAGLVATALLTLGMSLNLPGIWPLLRFLAGVASAFVFLFTSGWCLGQLARHGASGLGGVMYAGPGAGIMLSGLMCSGMVALQWHAATAWVILGVMASILTSIVWRTFHASNEKPIDPIAAAVPSAAAGVVPAKVRASRSQMLVLALAYGLAGLGYIVTATFLPVIARQALPGSPFLDMFWPMLGLGVMVGALLSTRVPLTGDLRYLLAGCYFIQALSIGISLWSPTLPGFVIGSFVLGIPFTALTFFAMQEVRRLRPDTATSYMGLLTAVYGVGQIAGPPMVAVMLRRTATVEAGFTLSLEIAAGALVLGALIYLWMTRMWPMNPERPRRAA
ncbi:YbfB/YjiJ family MFS transporter [Polaromonas sp.]|uniref:YbfB/YjiJ family MFS transporter n=1 Tax=Polaromonas sp. TaxID=1869339 RepID=UPI0025EFF5C2|nr:YbfB/YjiJ family MFS transporter [Polaromonas sp.]